jgi:hypothetical protein
MIVEVPSSKAPAVVSQSENLTDDKDDVHDDAGIPVGNGKSHCPGRAETWDNEDADVAAETDALKSNCKEELKMSTDNGSAPEQSNQSENGVCWCAFTKPALVLFNAWRTYAQQRVVFASVSLSLLYMTVLGFDSITTG